MKKTLMIIGGIFVSIILTFLLIILIIQITSKKLVCTSNEGNITIMYNDKTITGYTARGISYDLHNQKIYAEEIGIDSYLEEFSNWFQTNTTGSCTK